MVAEEILPLQRPTSGEYDRKVARGMRDLENDISELQDIAAMLACIMIEAELKRSDTADCLTLPPLLGNAVISSAVQIRDRVAALYERWQQAQAVEV